MARKRPTTLKRGGTQRPSESAATVWVVVQSWVDPAVRRSRELTRGCTRVDAFRPGQRRGRTVPMRRHGSQGHAPQQRDVRDPAPTANHNA
jgi:hypothetical protein